MIKPSEIAVFNYHKGKIVLEEKRGTIPFCNKKEVWIPIPLTRTFTLNVIFFHTGLT